MRDFYFCKPKISRDSAGSPFFARARAGMTVSPSAKRRSTQRGISLFIVLVILMMALIVVLGGLVLANLNESVVGSQSDAQRAYGVAEALLDAAQRDIRLNGRYCNADGLGTAGTNATITITVATHIQAAPCTLRYPRNMTDYIQMLTGDATGGQIARDQCAPQGSPYQGICISSSPASGQFTLATAADDGPARAEKWVAGIDYNNKFIAALNNKTDYGASAAPDLTANGIENDSRGKYWVEIYPYNVMATALSAAPVNVTVPDGTYPFIFRVTAMAKGLRGDTVSILRTYYVPYPARPVPAAS